MQVLHLGVVSTTPGALVQVDAIDHLLSGIRPNADGRPGFMGRLTTANGTTFIKDSDSYTAWGEPLGCYDATHLDRPQIDALHFTTEPFSVGDPLKVTALTLGYVADLTAAIAPYGLRVVDYAVLTDADVWSEEAKVIGFYA